MMPGYKAWFYVRDPMQKSVGPYYFFLLLWVAKEVLREKVSML